MVSVPFASDASAQPAVYGGPFRGRELACQRTHRLGLDTGMALGVFRGEHRALLTQPIQSVSLDPGPAADQPLLEEHLQDRQEQVCIRIRSDPEPFELGGGLAAPGIDHHHPSTPLDDVVHAVLDPRCGQETSMGHHRIRAEHDQQLGPHQVRYRHRERCSVEELVGQQATAGVLGRGAEEVAVAADALGERHRGEQV